jgi:hypothetical protein
MAVVGSGHQPKAAATAGALKRAAGFFIGGFCRLSLPPFHKQHISSATLALSSVQGVAGV